MQDDSLLSRPFLRVAFFGGVLVLNFRISVFGCIALACVLRAERVLVMKRCRGLAFNHDQLLDIFRCPQLCPVRVRCTLVVYSSCPASD